MEFVRSYAVRLKIKPASAESGFETWASQAKEDDDGSIETNHVFIVEAAQEDRQI